MREYFCPLHKAKLRKNTLFIDQSAFSNFALYVITTKMIVAVTSTTYAVATERPETEIEIVSICSSNT